MRADEHSPGHTAAPPAAGSIHHPTRTCPRLILLSYLRGNKNDAFQHMHPTSIFLCCRKDSSIQSVPQVTAPAHTQPSPATGCGRAPALRGVGAPTQTTHPPRCFRHALETAASTERMSLLGKHWPTDTTPLQAWETQQNPLTALTSQLANLLSPKTNQVAYLAVGNNPCCRVVPAIGPRNYLAIAKVTPQSLLTWDTHLCPVFHLLLVSPKPLLYRLCTTAPRNNKATTGGSLNLSGLKVLPTPLLISTTRCNKLAGLKVASPTHTWAPSCSHNWSVSLAANA